MHIYVPCSKVLLRTFFEITEISIWSGAHKLFCRLLNYSQFLTHRYIFLSFKWSFFQLHCVSKTPLIFVCVTTRWKSSSCNDASYTTFQGNFDNWRKIFCCTNLESDKSDFSIGYLAGRCLTAVSAQITVVHIDVCIRPGATTNYVLTKIKCNTHQPNLCADNLYSLHARRFIRSLSRQ